MAPIFLGRGSAKRHESSSRAGPPRLRSPRCDGRCASSQIGKSFSGKALGWMEGIVRRRRARTPPAPRRPGLGSSRGRSTAPARVPWGSADPGPGRVPGPLPRAAGPFGLVHAPGLGSSRGRAGASGSFSGPAPGGGGNGCTGGEAAWRFGLGSKFRAQGHGPGGSAPASSISKGLGSLPTQSGEMAASPGCPRVDRRPRPGGMPTKMAPGNRAQGSAGRAGMAGGPVACYKASREGSSRRGRVMARAKKTSGAARPPCSPG